MVQIEGTRESLLTCPECKSSEGFWLITKRDAELAQCKHYGIISEASQSIYSQKEDKRFRVSHKTSQIIKNSRYELFVATKKLK